MMLVGFIDFTYGANIGAVSSTVRKRCLDGQVTKMISLSKGIDQIKPISGVLNNKVNFSAIYKNNSVNIASKLAYARYSSGKINKRMNFSIRANSATPIFNIFSSIKNNAGIYGTVKTSIDFSALVKSCTINLNGAATQKLNLDIVLTTDC